MPPTGPLGYAALSAANRLGLPVSSTFHTNFHHYSRHYGAAFLTRPALAYLRHFHNRTRVTLSPTAELNAELARDGFQNLRLLSRGVTPGLHPVGAFTGAARILGRRTGRSRDRHVSRLAAEKNYSLLIEAYRAVAAARSGVRLVIASDGPMRRKLQRQIPSAVFTGFLNREDLARCYASGDLFLYPSLTETFGNVVTEAMASGLPVVAFNYAAAARYIRHAENGWHVPLGDAAAFVTPPSPSPRTPPCAAASANPPAPRP